MWYFISYMHDVLRYSDVTIGMKSIHTRPFDFRISLGNELCVWGDALFGRRSADAGLEVVFATCLTTLGVQRIIPLLYFQGSSTWFIVESYL